MLSSLQLRQENEALRGQLEGAMIPDRNDTDTSMQGVTDASKEEIETLQVRLDVASLYSLYASPESETLACFKMCFTHLLNHRKVPVGK